MDLDRRRFANGAIESEDEPLAAAVLRMLAAILSHQLHALGRLHVGSNACSGDARGADHASRKQVERAIAELHDIQCRKRAF
jgi:hypothetical protein